MKKYFYNKYPVLTAILFAICVSPSIFWEIIKLFAPGSGVGIFGVIAFAFYIAIAVAIIIPIYAFLWSKGKKRGIVIFNIILFTFICNFFVSVYAGFNLKIYQISLPILVLLCMCLNSIEKKFLLKYADLMIVLFTIAFCCIENINHMNKVTLNAFDKKVGYKGIYNDEKYKIPYMYDEISKFPKEIKYACPYFKAKKDGKASYLNMYNENIFTDFDNVIELEPYKNATNKNDWQKIYFKVSKNGKFGLYEINLKHCKEGRLTIPCEHEDIQVNGSNDFEKDGMFYAIVKNNDKYDLYAKVDYPSWKTSNTNFENFVKILSDKSYISIDRDFEDTVKIKKIYKEVDPKSYRCSKITTEKGVFYLSEKYIINRENSLYYKIEDFKFKPIEQTSDAELNRIYLEKQIERRMLEQTKQMKLRQEQALKRREEIKKDIQLRFQERKQRKIRYTGNTSLPLPREID